MFKIKEWFPTMEFLLGSVGVGIGEIKNYSCLNQFQPKTTFYTNCCWSWSCDIFLSAGAKKIVVQGNILFRLKLDLICMILNSRSKYNLWILVNLLLFLCFDPLNSLCHFPARDLCVYIWAPSIINWDERLCTSSLF